jgi:hypothetical protein
MFQLLRPPVFRFGLPVNWNIGSALVVDCSSSANSIGHPYSSGLTDAQEIGTLVCVSLAVICWSWVGLVPGMLSGDTLFVLFAHRYDEPM